MTIYSNLTAVKNKMRTFRLELLEGGFFSLLTANSLYAKLMCPVFISTGHTEMKHPADLEPDSKSLDIKCSSFRS